MLSSLMMDDFQLSPTVLVERADRLNSDTKVVSRRPDGAAHRATPRFETTTLRGRFVEAPRWP